MKKVKQEEFEALKQYVTKELQTKRFLTDSIDMLEVFEKIIAEKSEHEATVANMLDDIRKKADILNDVSAEVEKENEKLKLVKAEVSDVTLAAKNKAEQIVINAQNTANALINEAEQEIKAAQEFATANAEKLRIIQLEINALTMQKETLEAEIAKIKAKFA